MLLFVYSLFQFFAVALFFTTANVIFLRDHSISQLPYVYIATGILMVVLAYFSSRMEAFASPQKIIFGETILIFFIILGFKLGFLSEQISWLGYGLIIWHRLMSDYVEDGFNKLILLFFDVRQSKRLYGLVSSSEIPASILGYFAAYLLVPIIGTANLLWVTAAAMLISLVFLSFIVSGKKDWPTHDVEEESVEKHAVSEDRSLLLKFFKSPFIISLSTAVFFSVIAFIFIEFTFLNYVDTGFTNEQEIAQIITIVFGVGQFIALFIKTFLYQFIQRRFGVKVSLFILPFSLGLICLVTLVEPLFAEEGFMLLYTWVIIMLVSETLRSSVYNSTFISLLQPMERRLKMEGFSIINNVEGIAIALSGSVILIFLSLQSVDLQHYSFALLFVVIGWIAVIPKVNKRYLTTLEDVLKKRIVEGGVLQLDNPQTLQIVHEKLNSSHPGEVLYALDVLCKEKNLRHAEILGPLLMHRLPEVRKEVYKRIETLKITALQNAVKVRIRMEPLPELQRVVIRTYCALGEAAVVDEISPLLDAENKEIQTGALVGLICFGGINGIIVAGQRLMEYVNSPDAELRAFAAYVIGEVGIHNFYHPLLVLLRDENIDVEKEALKAAGKIRHPKLYDAMVKAVSTPNIFEVAMNALVKSGEEVVDYLEPEIPRIQNPVHLRRLVHVCGRIGGTKTVMLLKNMLYFDNIDVRNQVVHSCALCGFKPGQSEKKDILNTIHKELADAAWFLNCIDAMIITDQWMEKSELQLLIRALKIELAHVKKRLLYLLSFLYESREILQVWESLQLNNKEKKANALEILDMLASKDLTGLILPMFEDFTINQQAKNLNARYAMKRLSVDQYLASLISGKGCPSVIAWTRAVAAYVSKQIRVANLLEELKNAASPAFPQDGDSGLLAETARWTLKKIAAENHDYTWQENNEQKFTQLSLLDTEPMSTKLLTIEKVMALKTTGIFRETSEDLLVDIAYILKELSYKKGEMIVQKGEVGTCMFVIYSGSVKVHDGEHTLAVLKSRDFFGELSLLDAEPRSASVTAVEDSLLLRIDQLAFYEIMADRMEVIREIMKILCRRLRQQNDEVAKLKNRIPAGKVQEPNPQSLDSTVVPE